jgi:hypothetical protein
LHEHPLAGILWFYDYIFGTLLENDEDKQNIYARHMIRRTKAFESEVMIPFLLLFGSNVAVLALWTYFDPLIYGRENLPGTDGWNRVIATYGSCQSNDVKRFLVPMAILNVSVLVLANWQAYGPVTSRRSSRRRNISV